ncbi:PAS domain-containing protein [Patescibacteria group bacterium]|nr:MAG: PAS domain-containing protein [Patescibacteria group bacterium]
MDLLTRRYSILASLLAYLGGVVASVTLLIFVLAPDKTPQNITLAVMLGGSGAILLAYYLSLHQLLKKNHLQLSTGIMAVLAAISEFILINATGGPDSPYYSLWILAIVIAGLFGQVATITVVFMTLLYFVYVFWTHDFNQTYIATHLGIVLMTIGTGAIAEWIHLFLGRGMVRASQVEKLAGQLGEEELKSEAIMRSVGDGILVIDTKRRIQLFNPAATRLTGWDAGSAHGIDYRLVLNLRDAEGKKLSDDTDPFTQVWREGKSKVRDDLTLETKNGRKLSASLSLSPLTDNKKQIRGGILLFRDISAEKEVERQRNEFISTASHEMRTPVAAIEGYLALAMNANVATIDDRAKQYLDKAHHATQHLGALFKDLLSITTIDDEQHTPSEVFDLGATIKEVVDDMKIQAEKKGLEVQLETSDVRVRGEHAVVPVYAVKAAPSRILEVVSNLVENAIKYTQTGTIRVTIGGTSEAVTVSVIDTGMGIAAEDIPHLFQKFYRVDNSATRTIGGTGLGLYLCRSIIEHSGGRIWVESKPGEGSAFKFTLPRLASDKITKAAASVAVSPGTTTATAMPAAPPYSVATKPSSKSGKVMTDIHKPAVAT